MTKRLSPRRLKSACAFAHRERARLSRVRCADSAQLAAKLFQRSKCDPDLMRSLALIAACSLARGDALPYPAQ